MIDLSRERKGITPVIAIVLLLMVTVGAVGVVYTQFNSLVGDPAQQFDDQQRDQNTRISITQVRANGSINSADPSDDVTVEMTVTNSGSVARNTTAFLVTASGQGSGAEANCFTAENSKILDPNEQFTCETGIPFPGVTEETTLEVRLTGTSKTYTYSCRPTTTGDETC